MALRNPHLNLQNPGLRITCCQARATGVVECGHTKWTFFAGKFLVDSGGTICCPLLSASGESLQARLNRPIRLLRSWRQGYRNCDPWLRVGGLVFWSRHHRTRSATVVRRDERISPLRSPRPQLADSQTWLGPFVRRSRRLARLLLCLNRGHCAIRSHSILTKHNST